MTDLLDPVATAPEQPEPQTQVCASSVMSTVSSVKEFADLLIDAVGSGNKFWFRGTRDSTHKLIPSLYRHPTVHGADRLIDLEWQLLSEFRHQAPPFASKMPSDNLELLFLMQHYGVPTRLLDWTENPFIALFFAL
jgi:hypothetical protein